MAAADNWLLVGITGVTCGGKTTLANKIKDKFSDNCVVIHQDNYFYLDDSPHHVKVPGLDHNNYDILSSLDMNKMYKDVVKTISNDLSADESKICNSFSTCGLKILVVEGFSVLNYKPIADVCKLKYEIFLTKSECIERRSGRVYDPPDIPGYFELCVWPEYLKYHEDLKKQSDIIHLNGTEKNLHKRILEDIKNCLNA